jgi:hypothetical protein
MDYRQKKHLRDGIPAEQPDIALAQRRCGQEGHWILSIGDVAGHQRPENLSVKGQRKKSEDQVPIYSGYIAPAFVLSYIKMEREFEVGKPPTVPVAFAFDQMGVTTYRINESPKVPMQDCYNQRSGPT